MLANPIPDLDAALVAFLEAHPALVPLHGGRVATEIHGAEPQLRITALGGTQLVPWEATAEYQIDAWGGTAQEAHMLASTALTAIYDMRGPITGGRVTSAEPSLRPISQPDTDTGRARYITQVSLTVYPT